MQSFTGFPIPNTPMARAVIRENAGDMIDDYLGRLIRYAMTTQSGVDKYIDMAVSSFMSQYPRGKGTAKDEGKRRFYAACHALHARRSRRHRLRRDTQLLAKTDALSPGQYAALMHFPIDGTFLLYPTRNGAKIDAKIINRLVELGYLTGTYEESRGRIIPAQFWITDLGIEARNIAHRIRERARKEKVANNITVGPDNEDEATISIDGEVVVRVSRPAREDAVALRDKIIALMQQEARS